MTFGDIALIVVGMGAVLVMAVVVAYSIGCARLPASHAKWLQDWIEGSLNVKQPGGQPGHAGPVTAVPGGRLVRPKPTRQARQSDPAVPMREASSDVPSEPDEVS